MHVYKGIINVGGGPGKSAASKTEIHRGFLHNDQLTAPEIVALRHVHGDDNVYGLESMGDVAVNPNRERRRLTLLYGEAVVERLFGPASAPHPLPDMVDMMPDSARDDTDLTDDENDLGDLRVPVPSKIDGAASPHKAKTAKAA